MSDSTPQRGIPQTGIGLSTSGSQVFVAQQGLVANAPWISPDGTLSPGAFRFLLSLVVAINNLGREVMTLEQRLTNAGL